MIALLPAVFVSSLAGSIHCIAMCGPLVGLHGGGRSLRLALVHALGRLATYAALGAAAGAVGGAIDLAGRLGTVQHAATLIASVVIIGWGVHAIAVAAGWRRTARARGSAFTSGLLQIRSARPAARAWLVGALTGLLPCGWLWAFVVSAAGTANPLAGATLMAVFWLGTVPAMTGMLMLAGPLVRRLRARLPIVTATVLIGLGLFTLATRWSDAGERGVAHPHCHETPR